MGDPEKFIGRKFLSRAEFNRIRRSWMIDVLKEAAADPKPYDDLLDGDPVDIDTVRERKEVQAKARQLLKGDYTNDIS